MNETHLPRRRFLRYSLRALLLLTAGIGGAIGWTIHEARQQGNALAALEWEACCAFVVEDRGPPSILEIFRWLLGDTQPRNVIGVVAHSRFAEADLIHLYGLKHLEYLTVIDAPITDDGLAQLRGMTQLAELNLLNTHVTDAGVHDLNAVLPRLSIYVSP